MTTSIADWPTTSVSASVAASADVVWALATDIALLPGFSEELQSIEWLDGDPPNVGARFVGTNANSVIGTWTTTSTVVECDAPRAFEWCVGDVSSPVARWRFDVEGGVDGSILRYTARLGPGRSGLTVVIERSPHRREEIVAARLRQFVRGMTATVDGLKQLAESCPPVPRRR